MKTPYVILLLFVLTFGAVAQQQTSTLPPMQLWESVAYKNFAIEMVASDEIATPAVMDSTENLDTLISSTDLIGRGDVVRFTLRLANAGDSVKIQQYDLNGDQWYDLPISRLTNRTDRPNGASWQLRNGRDDTTSTVVTGLGFTYTGITYEMSVPNRTNGEIRMLRG
ncbi:hypothetical protein LCGC14_2030040, partial [marine sediment metagenome]